MRDCAAALLLLFALSHTGKTFAASCLTAPPRVFGGTFQAAASQDGTPAGTVLTAVCNTGYTVAPAPTTTCRATGQWSQPSSMCLPVCLGLPTMAVPGITWPALCNSTVRLGGACQAQCGPGWTGYVRLYCSGTRWRDAASLLYGQCTPVRCAGKPAPLARATWPDECSNAMAGTRCNSTCSTGPTTNTSVGTPWSLCQADGTWSVPSSPAMCPPTLPDNGGLPGAALPADVALEVATDCAAGLAPGTPTAVSFAVRAVVNPQFIQNLSVNAYYDAQLAAGGARWTCKDKAGAALPPCSAPQPSGDSTQVAVICAIPSLAAAAPVLCTLSYTTPASGATLSVDQVVADLSFAKLPDNVVDDASNNMAAACVRQP